jgi:hypothetical protein
VANEKTESTAHAITFLKATLDTPREVNPIAHWMIEGAVKSDEEMAKLLSGLLNVSIILLVRQEEQTGLTAEQILEDIARKYTDT